MKSKVILPLCNHDTLSSRVLVYFHKLNREQLQLLAGFDLLPLLWFEAIWMRIKSAQLASKPTNPVSLGRPNPAFISPKQRKQNICNFFTATNNMCL